MIKTLQIGMGWFPEQAGGLNRYYYDCSQYLPEVGVEVQGLVTGSEQVTQATAGKIISAAPREANLLQRWRGIRQASSQIDLDQYSIIVSHFALYTFPVLNQIGDAASRQQSDRPLVTHFHGPWALEGGVEGNKISAWWKKQIEQACYRRSHKFIVLSQTFRDILHQEYQVPLEKIAVVPGGVDIGRFDINLSPTEARSQLGWHQDRPTIFCVRRLAKRMGIDNLITAMTQVVKKHPDVMLYIAGKGALAESLQQQIQTLELQNHVQLLGYVSDEQLPLGYRAANFSVVPTVALEGFGLIVVESLAAGTPVLGTPVGGIPEILRPFDPDLVFEGSEPAHLAAGMIAALDGGKLPTASDCQQYAQQNYDWLAIANQIKAVYQSVLT